MSKRQRIAGIIHDKNHVNLQKNFSFDFLGLDNVDLINYFANELIRWVVFKSFKTSELISKLFKFLSYLQISHRLTLAKNDACKQNLQKKLLTNRVGRTHRYQILGISLA
jgi:hypothetical protein